ncbi:sugar transporter SWEET1-like [Nematolebias whitei]|uniref:sugar transporter SWEET1-like n=1 Tax=Nematolebias whitei TaxID=451745 RepID=UPI0018989519|nr:sugar transporter SWEET1-like [Nematolebias whitei]
MCVFVAAGLMHANNVELALQNGLQGHRALLLASALHCPITPVLVHQPERNATLASAVTTLAEIVRSGNVQCLSFPLSVATFFTSTSWVLYGLQLNDYYIMVPNTPGIVTSLIRFYLFWRFASDDPSLPTYKVMQL